MEGAFGQLPFAITAGQEKVGQMMVVRVYWLNPTSSGDTFTLQDASGNVIVTGRCEAANQSQWFDFSSMPISVNGVGVGQLSSGSIYVYPA